MDRVSIEINYIKALKQADDLEEAAKKLSRIAMSQIEDTCGDILRNWEGDNSRKYIGKVRKVQGDIKEVSEDLKQTARSIRNIAKITYQADLAALTIAQKRNI